MVKLNLSVTALLVMLGILTIIQLIPASSETLPQLYNFQKIMSYAFMLLLFHFIVGITLLAVYKALRLFIKNKFLQTSLDFLISFDDKSYNKLVKYVNEERGIISFS